MQYSANKKVLLAVLVAAAATMAVDANAKKPSAGAKPAAAAAATVAVDVPPPSGNWEGKPPPAEGYVWSGGYYEWKDGHYAWKAGEWVLAKPGMEYRQHKWAQRADGKWVLTGGNWVAPGESVARKQ